MKTIKSQIIARLAELAVKHVADSTCFNYHNNNFGSNSNLAKTINKLPTLENARYLVVVGAKGRSQHSATDLHIFEVPNNVLVGSDDVCFRTHWLITH